MSAALCPGRLQDNGVRNKVGTCALQNAASTSPTNLSLSAQSRPRAGALRQLLHRTTVARARATLRASCVASRWALGRRMFGASRIADSAGCWGASCLDSWGQVSARCVTIKRVHAASQAMTRLHNADRNATQDASIVNEDAPPIVQGRRTRPVRTIYTKAATHL